MGFRLLVVILGFSLTAGVAEAASGKKGAGKKVKYETINGRQVQVEKVETVKASPLNAPESSRLREKRQQMEMETEEEFIQKLEQARIEDEKLRRQQLFEKELKVRESKMADPYLPPPEPEPPVVEFEEDALLEDEPVGMDWQPVSRMNDVTTTVIVDDVEPETPKFYFGLGAGGVNHQANNTPDLNGAFSVTMGSYIGNYFLIEGSFTYSFLESERVILPDEDIDMFNFAAVPKFTFGMSNQVVTPVVGPVLAFTRRQYNAGDNASNALDAGISAGVDIALNQKLKIGIEGRYMTNLDYEKDQPIDSTEKALEEFATGRDIEPLESFDYTMFMANIKMVF